MDERDLWHSLRATNERDMDDLRQLSASIADDPSPLGAIRDLADRAGLGPRARNGWSLGMEPAGLADTDAARAFVDLMSRHPAVRERRRLDVALPLVGPGEDDPRLFDYRREASDLLALGAIVAGTLNLDDQFVEALVEVAIGPDAFSFLLRPLLVGKPIPDFDDPPIPQWLLDLAREIDRRTCLAGLVGALANFGVAAHGSRSTSDANGIISLNPNRACEGHTIEIYGSGFGAQAVGTEIFFPSRSGSCKPGEIVSWADTYIQVKVPQNVGVGCVGFVRRAAGAGNLAEAAAELAGQMEHCIGPAASQAASNLRHVGPFHFSCPPCLPDKANYFTGGVAQISHFAVNGGVDVEVEPGAQLVLSWAVTNATQVWITRISGTAPFTPPTSALPLTGSYSLGPFHGSSPATGTYRLTANNSCGQVERTVTVRLTKRPKLAIQAVEVVQAIQRADNSVSLVEGKRTAVRIFVDSGMTGGFNLGSGPDVQPNVTGRVIAFPVAGNQGFSLGPAWPPGTVAARPPSTMNRNDATHSLQFELPANLAAGDVDLHVRVAVSGHENDVGGDFVASTTTRLTFQPSATQEVLPFLIADPVWGLPAPTLAEFNTALQGARSRYPVADAGFIVNPPIAYSTSAFLRNRDLTTVLGWQLLLLDLVTMVFVLPSTPVGGVRAGLVPRDPQNLVDANGNQTQYALNGVAMTGTLLTVPSFLSQATLQGTFAHEFGHSVGLGHAPCPPPCAIANCADCNNPPDGIDSRLPGVTDDTGMDVASRTIIPVSRGEIMSYCGDTSRCRGVTRWPSTAAWDIIYGSLPI